MNPRDDFGLEIDMPAIVHNADKTYNGAYVIQHISDDGMSITLPSLGLLTYVSHASGFDWLSPAGLRYCISSFGLNYEEVIREKYFEMWFKESGLLPPPMLLPPPALEVKTASLFALLKIAIGTPVIVFTPERKFLAAAPVTLLRTSPDGNDHITVGGTEYTFGFVSTYENFQKWIAPSGAIHHLAFNKTFEQATTDGWWQQVYVSDEMEIPAASVN